MGAHHAAVFDYKKYQREVHRLVARVDQQDYNPLKERVCQVIKQLQDEWPLSDFGETRYRDGVIIEVLTQEWPLLEHGDDGLASIDDVRSISTPTAQDLGYWFLITLAKYLSPCISPMNNWYVLATVLESLGWSKPDSELLFCGFPTYKLIKPELTEPSIKPLTAKSPYWLWVQPSRAWSGWLPNAKIELLLDKLRHTKDQIVNFDLVMIPNIDVSNPIVVKDYSEYLQTGFDDTLAMLSVAKKRQLGLFMSITI